MNIRDYAALVREIAQLDTRITELEEEIADMTPRARQVSDTVTRGRKGKKILGTVKIEGVGDYQKINRKKEELRRRMETWHGLKIRAESEVEEIEKMVAAIEDTDTRRIIGFYVLDGYPNWEEVATQMGEGWTAEACRKRYSRYIRQRGKE